MRRFRSAELFAVLISTTSIVISVLGNRTQERLLAASVWPYLTFGHGNTSDDGQKRIIGLRVTNSGNGPARVRQFNLEYEHQEIASASVLLDRCCGIKNAPMIITSPIVGKVLRSGEEVALLQLPFSEDIADGWQRLNKARYDFTYSACYCSTLNDCWNVRSDQSDPTPVAACGNMPSKDQWHG